MSKLSIPLLSTEAAGTINLKLKELGQPTVDRVVIAVSNKDFTTNSGIIIPGGNKEEVPRKGTLVQVGLISDDYKYFRDLLNIGSMVTYGNYAGKKIEPSNLELDGFDLVVLSITEICYVEYPNK